MKKSRKRSLKGKKRKTRQTKYGGKMRRNRRRSSKHTRKHRRQSRRYIQQGGWNLGNIMAELPFGQDIVNVGRTAGAGMTDIYRGYKGVHPTASNWPTRGQLTAPLGKSGSGSGGGTGIPDIAALYKKNKSSVKGI